MSGDQAGPGQSTNQRRGAPRHGRRTRRLARSTRGAAALLAVLVALVAAGGCGSDGAPTAAQTPASLDVDARENTYGLPYPFDLLASPAEVEAQIASGSPTVVAIVADDPARDQELVSLHDLAGRYRERATVMAVRERDRRSQYPNTWYSEEGDVVLFAGGERRLQCSWPMSPESTERCMSAIL